MERPKETDWIKLSASWEFAKFLIRVESRNFPQIVEPRGSLPVSQQPFACPYPERDQASPPSLILALEDPF